MDFVGRKIRLQLANELPKTFSALSYRGGERTIELAVKQKLPVLRIKAHDIGRQHIDSEIRRELRDALAVLLGKAVSLIACHESAHAPSPRLWTRAPDAFFDCQPSITGLAHQLSEARISLDTLAAQPAAAHTRDPRATFAALQIRRRCRTERDQIRLSPPARVYEIGR